MGEESGDMYSGDDKALVEKNKKRIVKTPAQVEALEKFYNEHKYPSESMKLQLAESIGLTEKQVSGWFCHRRLKDKKIINGENYASIRQDRSSGVVQDRGSGHRQDSCGSTKQGEDRNFDAREVESGRLTPKEFSAADLTYERGTHYGGNYNNNRNDDTSSGSSSSLRNMSNGVPFNVENSRCLVPKFPTDVKGVVKPMRGPSGYLKVKGQVENAAITAVKRQLGKHYREDGPPLGIEFDPLPPGVFESSSQEPVEETYYTEEAVLPTSPDVSRIRQNAKFDKRHQYKSSMASYNPNIDGASFKTRHTSDIPDNYSNQKLRQKSFISNSGTYYPRNNSFPESSARDVPGDESRDDYGMRQSRGVEVMRLDSDSTHPDLQLYGGKAREDQGQFWHRKYNGVGPKIALEENTGDEFSKFAPRGNEYTNTLDRRQTFKVPFKSDLPAPKRLREEVPLRQHLKMSSMVDDLPYAYQVVRPATEMPSSFSEDEESAETSSSVD